MLALSMATSTDHSTMPTVATALLSEAFTVNVAVPVAVPPPLAVVLPVPAEPPELGPPPVPVVGALPPQAVSVVVIRTAPLSVSRAACLIQREALRRE